MVESPSRQPRLLRSRLVQGVLVLTITTPQLHGYTLTNALRNELIAAVAQAGAVKVVLDFQPVTSITSETFRPLLRLRRKLDEAGGRLVLCNLSPLVAKAFEVTRLVSGSRTDFAVEADLVAALANLNKATPEE